MRHSFFTIQFRMSENQCDHDRATKRDASGTEAGRKRNRGGTEAEQKRNRSEKKPGNRVVLSGKINNISDIKYVQNKCKFIAKIPCRERPRAEP